MPIGCLMKCLWWVVIKEYNCKTVYLIWMCCSSTTVFICIWMLQSSFILGLLLYINASFFGWMYMNVYIYMNAPSLVWTLLPSYFSHHSSFINNIYECFSLNVTYECLYIYGFFWAAGFGLGKSFGLLFFGHSYICSHFECFSYCLHTHTHTDA